MGDTLAAILGVFGILFCMQIFYFTCFDHAMRGHVGGGKSCPLLCLDFGSTSLLVNMSLFVHHFEHFWYCFEANKGLHFLRFRPSCMLAPCLLHGCSIKPCSISIPWSNWFMFASCLYLVCLALYICHVGCIMLVVLYILVAWYIWALWALHALHLLCLGC
mgnify:CR=1 FL=1